MSIGLKGNNDGSGAIQIGGSDAISISTGLNTTFAGTVSATTVSATTVSAPSVQVTGVATNMYPLVSSTAVTASGTSVDFTGIPSWAKRITIMLSDVSTSGTSPMIIQLGDSGGIENTGYAGITKRLTSTSIVTAAAITNGSYVIPVTTAATVTQGTSMLTNVNSNIWSINSAFGSVTTDDTTYTVGNKTLSATLDRVRITTVNGTDTFDAGSINILYE
jgi:hypothetical protein